MPESFTIAAMSVSAGAFIALLPAIGYAIVLFKRLLASKQHLRVTEQRAESAHQMRLAMEARAASRGGSSISSKAAAQRKHSRHVLKPTRNSSSSNKEPMSA
ncbi:hypothetical protein SAMN04488518_101160 [Pseudovibrio ascidiaceicola]|uniref:Uncharacterized protein n=1 Tax=Pseudovibrio ascidiaceicola TaxID=285279 RepID=A0A1I3V5C9_9HYPH|nr:hypothetical protein [Pseudovibrio ascidiaceicola]SFJ89387.1 hypothetical protein SAMN04488518_101160 [Pseudovibrio ascidiaceicola]